MTCRFRLAMVQMHVEGGDRSGNLKRAAGRIAEAAANGAHCALLPEAMDLGWTHPFARSQAEPIPEGETFRALRTAVRDHRIHVCSGLTERSGDQVFNSAVLLDPQGNLLLLHRKLNELDIGHDLYSQGDRLNVCSTELGTIGLMICADGFAHDRVLSRSLGYMGADVILSPCAWAVPAEHDNAKDPYGKMWLDAYCPTASEFSMWIVGVSNVGWITGGPWKGMQCIGGSLAIGPDGREAAHGPYGVEADTIVYVDIRTVARPARGCGWADRWKAKADAGSAASE